MLFFYKQCLNTGILGSIAGSVSSIAIMVVIFSLVEDLAFSL